MKRKRESMSFLENILKNKGISLNKLSEYDIMDIMQTIMQTISIDIFIESILLKLFKNYETEKKNLKVNLKLKKGGVVEESDGIQFVKGKSELGEFLLKLKDEKLVNVPNFTIKPIKNIDEYSTEELKDRYSQPVSYHSVYHLFSDSPNFDMNGNNVGDGEVELRFPITETNEVEENDILYALDDVKVALKQIFTLSSMSYLQQTSLDSNIIDIINKLFGVDKQYNENGNLYLYLLKQCMEKIKPKIKPKEEQTNEDTKTIQVNGLQIFEIFRSLFVDKQNQMITDKSTQMLLMTFTNTQNHALFRQTESDENAYYYLHTYQELKNVHNSKRDLLKLQAEREHSREALVKLHMYVCYESTNNERVNNFIGNMVSVLHKHHDASKSETDIYKDSNELQHENKQVSFAEAFNTSLGKDQGKKYTELKELKSNIKIQKMTLHS